MAHGDSYPDYNKPYAICADIHFHNYAAFATLDERGLNSRLTSIIAEFRRIADEVKKVGGDFIVVAGDVFQVRGSVSPEVFNPVSELFEELSDDGVCVFGIPGNHDLTTKETTELGSSVKMLGKNAVFLHQPEIIHFPQVAMVPWVSTAIGTLEAIEKLANELGTSVSRYDLIGHRGLDGTLSNMPASGFTAEAVAEFGFKRAFFGDYHHHRDFGNNVYSIGALTHHNWGDVGTKAGFLMVHHDHVQWFCSNAPKFIDIADVEAAEDLPLVVDGEYVRARVKTAKPAEVNKWRNDLFAMGAKGVLIQTTAPLAIEKREGVSVKSLAALDQSVQDYVAERKMRSEVATICADILREIV